MIQSFWLPVNAGCMAKTLNNGSLMFCEGRLWDTDREEHQGCSVLRAVLVR